MTSMYVRVRHDGSTAAAETKFFVLVMYYYVNVGVLLASSTTGSL